MDFDRVSPMLIGVSGFLPKWRLTVVAEELESKQMEVRSFFDGGTHDFNEKEIGGIKAFFRSKFTDEERSPGRASRDDDNDDDDDEEITVYDVEKETEYVEKEVEESSAAKDAPQDEDEVATLEVVEKISASNSPPRPNDTAHLARMAERIPLSQTPARSVLLTPAPALMRVDDEDSDDDDTIIEDEIENPFLDETDEQDPSSSDQIDYLPSVTPGNERGPSAEPEMTDELMTTDYLSQFELAFNQKYKLVICQPCGAGIPLSSTYSHLRATCVKRMMWQEHLGRWRLTSIVLPHQPSVSMVPPKTKLIRKIVESLKAAGLVEDKSVILDISSSRQWYSSLPTPDLGPAVLGLRVFHGAYQCHMCDKLYLSTRSLESHYSTADHGGSYTDAYHSKTVQTLTEHHSSYFEVTDTVCYPSSDTLPPALEPDVDGDEDFQEAQRLLRLKQQFLTPMVKAAPTKDLRQVLPVYHQLGIHALLSELSDIRPVLRKPYERQLRNPVYKRLRIVVATAFITAMDDLDKLHNSIRMYITNCTPMVQQRFQRRSLTALTERKSTAAYASAELKFVWAILQASCVTNNERAIFVFDTVQLRSLQNLWSLISGRECDFEKAAVALNVVFQTVYYPQCPNTGLNTFNSPVIVFLLLETLEDNGEYRSIFLVPPAIAKMQYAMRLHATPLFLHWFRTEDHLVAERKSKRFCENHLQEANIAPFATVREWMHRFSKTSKQTPRAVSVWWKDNVVEVGDVKLNFPRYRSFLHQTLENLEQHIVEKVLLGVYTLADLEDMYKISNLTEPSPEDDVVGGGILLDTRDNQMQNKASTAFLAAIKKRRLLGFTVNHRGLFQFDLRESLEWLTNIDKAMHLLMPLCHVLEGPPGRMTEEAARRLTNTESTSRALVFEKQAGSGGFRSGYHKGSHVTGDHKVFLRLIPYRLFTLLFALIRVVRPLEFLVLSDFYVPEHKREETFNAYSESIFASMGKSWDAAKMRSVLERFFETGLDVRMGVRLFRHFAVGVQRHFPKTNYGLYDTAPDERRLAYIADLMAGHSTKVAEQYYAREESVIVGAIKKADCIRICQDWHALHEFSTARKEM